MENFPKRGSIYLVNLDPTIGAEIKKTRPAVIIQNDIGNKHSPLVIIAAITSREKARFDIEVEVKKGETGLDNDSVVLLNQIRSIDKERLIKNIGNLDNATMKKVEKAIKISLGILD